MIQKEAKGLLESARPWLRLPDPRGQFPDSGQVPEDREHQLSALHGSGALVACSMYQDVLSFSFLFPRNREKTAGQQEIDLRETHLVWYGTWMLGVLSPLP